MLMLGVRINIYTAPFLDTQELHYWSTLKVNVSMFQYMPLRKLLPQKRSKILTGGMEGGGGGGWGGGNGFLK